MIYHFSVLPYTPSWLLNTLFTMNKMSLSSFVTAISDLNSVCVESLPPHTMRTSITLYSHSITLAILLTISEPMSKLFFFIYEYFHPDHLFYLFACLLNLCCRLHPKLLRTKACAAGSYKSIEAIHPVFQDFGKPSRFSKSILHFWSNFCFLYCILMEAMQVNWHTGLKLYPVGISHC